MAIAYTLRDTDAGEYEYRYTFTVNEPESEVSVAQYDVQAFTKPPRIRTMSIVDAREEWRRLVALGYSQF